MARVNLQGLIDEVLGMVDEERRRKKSGDAQYQESLRRREEDESAYWKDIRGRNTELEKQKLINQGSLEGIREGNVGGLARQALVNTGGENVANIQAGASRYGADLGLRGHELQAEATKYTRDQNLKGDPVRDIILEGIKSGSIDPTNMESMNFAITNARQLTAAQPGGDDKDSYFSPPPDGNKGIPKAKGAPPPAFESPPSFLDIDRQMTEERNKKKYTGNKYVDWGLRRVRNIAWAGPRMLGAGLYGANEARKSLADWEGWER